MSKVKNHYHDQICAANEDDVPNMEAHPDFDKGVWFLDADSGMWFTNISDSDNIMAVRVNGEQFDRPAWWFQEQDKSFIESLDGDKAAF